MNRRDWIAQVAAALAVGFFGTELELVKKLGWKRTLIAIEPTKYTFYKHQLGYHITEELLEDDQYGQILTLNKDFQINKECAVDHYFTSFKTWHQSVPSPYPERRPKLITLGNKQGGILKEES